MTRNLVLWCFFMIETSEKIYNSTFQINIPRYENLICGMLFFHSSLDFCVANNLKFIYSQSLGLKYLSTEFDEVVFMPIFKLSH